MSRLSLPYLKFQLEVRNQETPTPDHTDKITVDEKFSDFENTRFVVHNLLKRILPVSSKVNAVHSYSSLQQRECRRLYDFPFFFKLIIQID